MWEETYHQQTMPQREDVKPLLAMIPLHCFALETLLLWNISFS